MPWIHVAAAVLLMLGTSVLFAFLRWVEGVDAAAAAPADPAPAAVPMSWRPALAVVAVAAKRASAAHARAGEVDAAEWRRAA